MAAAFGNRFNIFLYWSVFFFNLILDFAIQVLGIGLFSTETVKYVTLALFSLQVYFIFCFFLCYENRRSDFVFLLLGPLYLFAMSPNLVKLFVVSFCASSALFVLALTADGFQGSWAFFQTLAGYFSTVCIYIFCVYTQHSESEKAMYGHRFRVITAISFPFHGLIERFDKMRIESSHWFLFPEDVPSGF